MVYHTKHGTLSRVNLKANSQHTRKPSCMSTTVCDVFMGVVAMISPSARITSGSSSCGVGVEDGGGVGSTEAAASTAASAVVVGGVEPGLTWETFKKKVLFIYLLPLSTPSYNLFL